MSLWPSIYARPRPLVGWQRPPTRPSPVGRLQHSLDAPTNRVDKRPLRFTPWRSFRSSRPNPSGAWTRLVQTLLLSENCAARHRPGCTRHQDNGTGDQQVHGQPSGARVPPVVDADRDQGCGQGPIPGLTSLPHWLVRARC